jgi:insulysin
MKRIFIPLILLLVLLPSGAGAKVKDRQTKTLVLPNGLAVLLTYDPDVHRSAAALSVGTGSLYDPEDKMGLAHYLEHMLFLGTKKFPEPDEYTKYLQENSGAANAYTGDVVTNYFFQVSHEGFEGALDRFSQFFKAPLFDPQYSEREVNAVSSEHDKNKLSDNWRLQEVVNQTAEKGHPLRKFGTGDKETLAGDNRPALLDFYHKYYAASRMKLAMISNRSLAEQEDLARKYFSDIPDHKVELPPIDPDYRKPLKGKYRLLKIKAVKDIHALTLDFPTIRLHDHLDSKPASVVGSVLGYEGKGSLLSKLKEEGLALGLSAGGDYTHPNISSFTISVRLTPKGEKEYPRVLELVYAYLRMLKKHGFEEYTFNELRKMARIDFDWKNPEEGMRYVYVRSAQMQDYPLDQVETLPYLYRKFDPAAYKAVLDTLNPDNMLAVLQSRSVKTDRTEHYYGAEYSLKEVDGSAFRHLTDPPKAEGIAYPEKNPFVPDDLKLIEVTAVAVRDDSTAKVWYQFDTRFRQPKVYIRLRIETPRIYDTPADMARSLLYEGAVHESLNELVYPIQEAGLDYHLSVGKKGVDLMVGGYSERISDLLRLVAGHLVRFDIDKQKFKDIKEATIRGFENRKLEQAYRRAIYFNRLIWITRQYDEGQILEALRGITLDDLERYARDLYNQNFITGVVYGNVTKDQVFDEVHILQTAIGGLPLPEADRYQEHVEVLKPSDAVLYSGKIEDNNNAVFFRLQFGEMDFPERAKAALVGSIIRSDFYTQMRTNQQLGYLVWSFDNRVEKRLFVDMIIQSAEYGPFELKKRMEAWIRGAPAMFDSLSDEEFERYRQGEIVSLEKEGDSMGAVSGELFDYAVEEKGDFLFKKKLVEAVRNLKKEDVVETAHRLFGDEETPRSVVLIRARNNKDVVPEGVLTTVHELHDRKLVPVSAQ